MTAFKKFDPHTFLERERLASDSTVALAVLATLAGQPLENEIRGTASKVLYQCDAGAVTAKSIELQRDDQTLIHGLCKNQNLTPAPAKVAKVAKHQNFSNFSNLPTALDALERKCPDFVPDDRWRQAVEDARQFLAAWGDQPQTFSWTARELSGLHPTAPLSRLDHMGLIWLLQGRPVIALTATEAVMRCHSGVTLTYRRQNVREVETAPITKPTSEIANEAAQIAKPTPEAIEIAEGVAA